MQRDPIGYSDSVNLYEYGRAGPLSLRDLLGRRASGSSPTSQPAEPRGCAGLRKEILGLDNDIKSLYQNLDKDEAVAMMESV